MHCPGGTATGPIWTVLASSDGISSWTPLKPQHSNPNPNPLVKQLWGIDFFTPHIPLIIPHRLPALLESLMPFKNWCSFHARWFKSSLKHSIHFCGIFPKLKQNYHSSSRPDCIFEIHQLWQSDFSRVYSNSRCSCSIKPEIIKLGQSSHKMYSNNIVNFQESTTILNACTKESLQTFWRPHVILSQLSTTTYIENNLNYLGMKSTKFTTKIIKQILMNHSKNLISNACVYKIPGQIVKILYRRKK